MFRIFFGLLFAVVVPVSGEESRPNLLLFIADDMTYTDLGCYGNPDVKTPNVDRLVAEGLKFNRCYNSAPTCSPLRQSLYSGLYPGQERCAPESQSGL